MVMSIRQVVSTAIRTRLLEIPDLANAPELTNIDGNFKYFLGIASGLEDVPYIKSNHIFGGERTRTPRPEFDLLWQVGVVSEQQPTAEYFDALIYDALIRNRLVYLDNWEADQDITYNGVVFEPDTVQGKQFWMVGGYYRIRGTK